MQVNFKKKLNSLYIESFDFSVHLTKVQHYYSSTNAFQVVFSGKICLQGCFLKCEKLLIYKLYDFLPIPTTRIVHCIILKWTRPQKSRFRSFPAHLLCNGAINNRLVKFFELKQ